MSDEHKSGPFIIRASKGWLALFAIITLAPWGILLLLHAPELPKRLAHETHPLESDGMQQVPSSTGSWGDLRIVNVVNISKPDQKLE